MQNTELMVGMKQEYNMTVKQEHTASALLSGSLDVFATPSMIAHMEYTSALCVAPCLEEGFSTVGTAVNIKHLRASKRGSHIRFVSELTLIDRKRLEFDVKAYDDNGLIGEGTHERFIINVEKFMSKLD